MSESLRTLVGLITKLHLVANGNVNVFIQKYLPATSASQGCRLFTGAQQASGKANLTLVVMVVYNLCSGNVNPPIGSSYLVRDMSNIWNKLPVTLKLSNITVKLSCT